MNIKVKHKYLKIANHLKICVNALQHGKLYWENGEVIRFYVGHGRPLTKYELETRINQQRKMLKELINA